MKQVLKQLFSKATIEVNHDLMGAARALCGKKKGIACILGTGSNSCYFNGKKVEKNSPGLGYVLGDEGSGSYLGKKVIQYYLYKTFDEDLNNRFEKHYNETHESILNNVYKLPLPNRYLANFDFFHLFVNMFVLYSFGPPVESHFEFLLGGAGQTMFLIYYLLGIAIASLPTYFRHKNNFAYNSLGASGAVSAILFSYILFDPWNKIYLYGIIGIPGILAGVAYLIYSNYSDKRGVDNINHNAHFWGAIFGFIFPLTIKPVVFIYFIEKVFNITL